MKSEQHRLEELKVILEEEHNRPVTDEEAMLAFQLVKLLAEAAVKNAFIEVDRQAKLKDNPKGFHLEGSGTCGLCGQPAVKENSWYDKNGIKCIPCQKALDKKLIPVSVIKSKESWFSKHDLESYFNINRTDLNRYVRQGLLKNRIISLNEKQVHLELFLIKDNKEVLPPKKLLPSKIIKFEKDGEEYYTHAQWYACIDEKGAKKLLKYKISDILRETLSKSIKTGGLYFKSINPLFTVPR